LRPGGVTRGLKRVFVGASVRLATIWFWKSQVESTILEEGLKNWV
jgi:hypothetical protein